MAVFLKNILRSIKSNWLSIFSLVFFVSVISVVYAAATNLTHNLSSGINNLNAQSHPHDAFVDEKYLYGKAKFVSDQKNQKQIRYVTAFDRTYAPFYKTENGKLVFSHLDYLKTAQATAPGCRNEGSFADLGTKYIYQFLHPADMQFDSTSGHLLSTKIEVTAQCGPLSSPSKPFFLVQNSADKLSKEGYDYVAGLFNKNTKAGVSANSKGVVLSTLDDGLLYDVTYNNNQQAEAILLLKDSAIVNDLNSPKDNPKSDWTGAFNYFYQYFQSTNPNLAQYDITNDEAADAKSWLNPIVLASSLNRVDLNPLAVVINGYLNTHKLVDDAKKPDVQYLAQNIAKVVLRLIYNGWTAGSLVDYWKSLLSKIPSFDTLVGQYNNNNTTDTYSQLSDERKAIFTNTTDPQIHGTQNFWNTLKQAEKQNLLNIGKKVIVDYINQNATDTSNEMVNQIQRFIEKHRMWTVEQVLNNFAYADPETKKTTNYQVAFNRVKSLLVNQISSKNQKNNNQQTFSYKLIESDQPQKNGTDQLIINQGNNLFYQEPLDNYQILRDWLNLRSQYLKNSGFDQLQKPFIQMLIRASFTAPEIHELFVKYLQKLNGEPNAYLDENQASKFQKYLEQIYQGNWTYNGYELQFNFTKISDFRATLAIDTGEQSFTKVPAPAYITNRTSDFVVVSPSYAKFNHKTPISDQLYNQFAHDIANPTIDQSQWEGILDTFTANPQHNDHVITVGDTKLIIVGIGNRADFAFPSLSLLSIVPDPHNEGLIFVNQKGYSKLLFNNSAAFQENYLAIKYPQAVIDHHQSASFSDQLQKQLRSYLTPINNQVLFPADSTNVTFTASGYRVAFVHNIIKLLNLISYLLIAVVAILVLFGVVVLIRRYAKNNAMIFGNLGANGVPKITIISSMMLFVVIPSVIGPILGYFIGLFTQPYLFSIVQNYWFLPANFASFDFLTLIVYIAVPLVVLSLVAIIAAAITLKASSLTLMQENPIFKQTKWSLKLNNLFNSFSPIWKFRLIVAANSSSRILLLSVMSSLMLVVLIFVFGNLGKFDVVAKSEVAAKKYSYAIQYATPTKDALNPPLQSYSQLGQTYLDRLNQKAYVAYQKKLNDPDFTGSEVNFNQNNPLLVASNINNFYQQSDNTDKIAKDFISKVNVPNASAAQIQSAVSDLNAQVHINPLITNQWATDSTLSNFILRSNWDPAKKEYVSIPLPEPTSDRPESQLYYGSNFAGNATLKNFNINTLPDSAQSLKDIISGKSTNSSYTPQQIVALKQASLADLGFYDYADLNANNPNTTYAHNIYYADYVPTVSDISSTSRQKLTYDNNAFKLQNTSNTNQTPEDKVILAADGKPLFQPLADLYQSKQPILPNHNEANQKSYVSWTASSQYNEFNTGWQDQNKDFHTFDYGSNEKITLPLLNRLYRDNANYWVISREDQNNQNTSLGFFQNRVLVKLLLNHEIEISFLNLKFNTWDIISNLVNQFSPSVVSQLNKNNNALIRNIIESRYGPYFVNRFMSMIPTPSTLKLADGAQYNGHEVYQIAPKDLKPGVNTQINASFTPDAPVIIPGTYYLDSKKTVYVYFNIDQHKAGPSYKYNVFVLFRPDFLYFTYALLNDPAFANPNVGPSKLAFLNNAIDPDYSNPAKTWTTSGDVNFDRNEQVGLTATDSCSNDPTCKQVANFYDHTPNGDQTFTYLTGKVTNYPEDLTLYGLKQDRRGSYVRLYHQNHNINHLLYQQPTVEATRTIYPVIVNEFAARKYHWNVGSVFSYHPTNTTDANSLKLQLQTNHQTAWFKVVGISDTYYNSSIYLSQKSANEVLGLDPEYGYNGVFTQVVNAQKLPLQFTAALSINSPSGLYGRIVFDAQNAASAKLFSLPANNLGRGVYAPSPLSYLKQKYHINQKVSSGLDLLQVFNNVFGNSPYKPTINNLDDSQTTSLLFTKLRSTINAVISIVMVVFIPLLVIMVMMVTSLVIDDLKQLAIVMMMLGFNNWENTITVLTYLFPVLILALSLGFPLATVFLYSYVSVLFSAISVLLPIKVLAWYILASGGVLIGIFMFALLQSYWKIRTIFLPLAMKSTGF